jgi:hypothetical protein
MEFRFDLGQTCFRCPRGVGAVGNVVSVEAVGVGPLPMELLLIVIRYYLSCSLALALSLCPGPLGSRVGAVGVGTLGAIGVGAMAAVGLLELSVCCHVNL